MCCSLCIARYLDRFSTALPIFHSLIRMITSKPSCIHIYCMLTCAMSRSRPPVHCAVYSAFRRRKRLWGRLVSQPVFPENTSVIGELSVEQNPAETSLSTEIVESSRPVLEIAPWRLHKMAAASSPTRMAATADCRAGNSTLATACPTPVRSSSFSPPMKSAKNWPLYPGNSRPLATSTTSWENSSPLLAQNRISRRDAVSLAYIAQLMLHSLPSVRREIKDGLGHASWQETLSTVFSDGSGAADNQPAHNEHLHENSL